MTKTAFLQNDLTVFPPQKHPNCLHVFANKSICPPGGRKMLMTAMSDGKYTDYHMQVKRKKVKKLSNVLKKKKKN